MKFNEIQFNIKYHGNDISVNLDSNPAWSLLQTRGYGKYFGPDNISTLKGKVYSDNAQQKVSIRDELYCLWLLVIEILDSCYSCHRPYPSSPAISIMSDKFTSDHWPNNLWWGFNLSNIGRSWFNCGQFQSLALAWVS